MSMERSTEISGFLNGREYTADFLYELLSLIVGNGVYANELEPMASNENMTITHGTGHAWINGVCYKNTIPFDLAIGTADGILNRYDSLMLRLNLSINEVYATIVQGDYAMNPTPPAVTRNTDIFDLKICDIYIPAGCTKITQNLITDTRLDNSVCGVPVFPVEHLDMSTFYRQVATDLDNLKNKEQAEIQELLKQLNDLLEKDTVGKLIAEINKKLSEDIAEEMYAPKTHVEDKNNPHASTAEQVGARPDTWLPTIKDIGAIRMDLLWTNASPTSSFATQTLSLGLSSYSAYIIVARQAESASNATSVMQKTGGHAVLSLPRYDTAPIIYSRAVDYTGGSLKFYDAWNNTTKDNTVLIPMYIYGIKGVLY